jgi:hypothetical protein
LEGIWLIDLNKVCLDSSGRKKRTVNFSTGSGALLIRRAHWVEEEELEGNELGLPVGVSAAE